MRCHSSTISAASALAAATLFASTALCAEQPAPRGRSSDASYREAIAAATARLEKRPKDAEALVDRGLAALKLGDLASAAKDLSLAMQVAPANGRVWAAQGSLLFSMGRFAESVAAFDSAFVRGVKSAEAFMQRGQAFAALNKPDAAIASYSRALDAEPSCAEAFARRAFIYARQGKWDQAFADSDQAVELEPQRAVFRAWRGVDHLDHGDVEEGIADIVAAIDLNPGDAGIKFQAVTNKPLSAESLEHGEQQLRHMLRDRPQMASHIVEGDKLWTWAVRKFAGEEMGSPVDWDPASPAPQGACSIPAQDGKHGAIRVAAIGPNGTSDREADFELLWSRAAFELYNVTSFKQWDEIAAKVVRGELRRNAYILAMLNSEENATERTRAFYVTYFLPWRNPQKVDVVTADMWNCTQFFAEGDPKKDTSLWRADLRWRFYEACYDSTRADVAYQERDYERARKLYEAVLARQDSISPDAIQRTYSQLGWVLAARGEFKNAVEHFDAALAIQPADVWSLLGRGSARSSLRDFDLALADYTEAILLDPKSVEAREYRSTEFARREMYDKAIDDVDVIVERQPTVARWHGQRGSWQAALGDFAKAIEDFDAVIRIDPKYARGYVARGAARSQKGLLAEAKADLEEAMRISGDDPYTVNSLAWFLATGPDPKYRDGKRAVELATKGCELTAWKYPGVDTLAAAYAEAGDFDKAVEMQRKAIDLAPDDQKKDLQSRLELYQRKEAYHVRASAQP